jgi:hypothetical protein
MQTQSEHELVVRACDQGSLCSTAIAHVLVDDLNDNAPKFDEKQLAALSAPADRRGFIGRLFAVDSDAPGQNSKLRYWLEGTEAIEVGTTSLAFSKYFIVYFLPIRLMPLAVFLPKTY